MKSNRSFRIKLAAYDLGKSASSAAQSARDLTHTLQKIQYESLEEKGFWNSDENTVWYINAPDEKSSKDAKQRLRLLVGGYANIKASLNQNPK